ncbi:protein-glutamine gamma-glutamyltransferase K-like isoform X1 [Mizuhopecten yessoensis]|uniref:Protein-glutamine gamma-glutamyltransferase K n=1 Tax=Mizuhopecten yessoensis TaxID=6573 RepID=A0A210R0R0_MIZYE|nr:protein-glutamine gamma-glutamyltransferase K-like isoform X1 [Mizuhopecten yessoensis]OWF54544.1 Protein-glutamine gamma-glutamyltransferase K [Mizuhopecten yessoensis]
MHRDKYEITPEHRTKLTDRLTSYCGNIRSLLLGGILTGRRSTYQVDEFPDEGHAQTNRKEKDGKEDTQLKPRCVDLQRTFNRSVHRTSAYEIPNLILRRGQTFDISITFDRSFTESTDDIVLKFVTGRQPLQSKGTVVPVTKVREISPGKWGYQILGVEDKKVNIKVCSGSDAIVGRYQLFIDTTHKENDGTIETCRYSHPDDIYVIFNPWCPDDLVFLDDENLRQEYVVNETGRIWMGTVRKFCVRPWNFAQFDDVCLVAALAMMEKSELGDPARGNPLLVVRALSRVINNNERDGGVLIGNWSGKYDDGVAPYAWNGSAAILEEFLKKRKGVKFGQCWTFAAVATTVFRALGIPTRCVTNFRSAHDSDFSTQIDNFWTESGKPRKMMNDTIWDFHVWNESWFRRSDLPSGYNGWQAYDPTPQECYEGVFTCGPASVKAIRDGELYLGFDAKFLFAEVNGTRVHWTVDAEGNMEPIEEERDIAGHFISTKAASTISREDVTHCYKHPTDSQEYAAAMERANNLSCRNWKPIKSPGACDVDFTFSGEMKKNGDIHISLGMFNTSVESRVVEGNIVAISTKYTSVPATELRESTATNILEPASDGELSLTVKCSDYINNIDPDSHVSIYVMATVKETGQHVIKRDIFRAEHPNLDLKAEGTATVGKPLDVIIKLVNTLSVPLSGGYINLEGPGMHKPSAVKIKKSIAPDEEIRETIQIKPRRAGRREIIACFQCKQICDVTGVIEIEVVGEK